jgi:DNA-binding protein HU-beta
MNKSDIITKMVETTNLTQAESDEALTALLDTIKEALKNGEKITLIDFGSFSVVERKVRMGRNPKTGEPIEIPASRSVKFKPSEKLKEVVSGRQSQSNSHSPHVAES